MMKIEQLSSAPDRAGRYRVQFSDGTVMRLYRQTVEDFGIFTGLELDEDSLKHLQTVAGEMSAKMRAVRIVSASNVSKKDLKQRLVLKGEDPLQAETAVQWMEQLDLINDEKTAESIVSRCIRKGYGLARAKQALYEKKIPKELWDAALEDYPEQTDAILEYLLSHLSQNPEQKEIRKAVDALLRRGHSYCDIRRVLDQMLMNTEQFPEE